MERRNILGEVGTGKRIASFPCGQADLHMWNGKQSDLEAVHFGTLPDFFYVQAPFGL